MMKYACIGCGRIGIDRHHSPVFHFPDDPLSLQVFGVVLAGNMIRHVCEDCDPVTVLPDALERREAVRASRRADLEKP